MSDIRFRYNKCAVALFLVAAFVLSLLSSLDCVFIKVDVGFKPENVVSGDESSSKSTFGIGIWTLEDVTNEGKCVMSIPLAEDATSLTVDDDIYIKFLIVGDDIFTCIRFLALFGFAFGLILLICAWWSVLSILKSRRKNVTVLNLTIISFMFEGLKIGMIFMTAPCMGKDFWDDPEDGKSKQADQCQLGRGSYMSIASVIIYFTLVVYAVLGIMFHDYSHAGGHVAYDEISMPSFLHSIGSRSGISRAQDSSSGVTPLTAGDMTEAQA